MDEMAEITLEAVRNIFWRTLKSRQVRLQTRVAYASRTHQYDNYDNHYHHHYDNYNDNYESDNKSDNKGYSNA